MAITRVNKLGTVTGGSGLSSLSLTVGATTTAHNRIIVAVWWGSSFHNATVSDSAGNNYTQDASGTAPGAGGWGGIFSGRGDNVLTSGSSTITVTWTGGTVNDAILFAYEYSGLANFAPVDVSNVGTGTSASPTSSVTTTKANELVFGAIGYSTIGNLTVPSQTQLDFVHGSSHSLETQEDIVSATGTYTVSATLVSSPNWADMVVGYADTANATSGQPVNTTAPVITGSGMLGMQLTCSQGSWTNQPTSYSYQWTRAGVNITGATGAHYLVTSSDLTHALGCVVTATNKYAGITATASNTVTPAVKSVAAGLGI